MPFQDVDDVSTEPVRTPSSVERVLRRIFVEDWSLKLLSLAVTLVLWLVVTSQNEPVTTHVNVQLNFVRPQSLEISNDPPKTVDVTLRGSRSKLDDLSLPDLVATVDLTDQRAGERVLRLAEKAQITLPRGVEVRGFLPSAIPIRLEQIVERQLMTSARFEGSPATGYEVYGVTPSAGTITVRGPASHVNALDRAPTETIWLSGQKETFTATNVAIDIPDPKVDLVDPAVDVRVEIGERRTEKSFTDVPLIGNDGTKIEPRTATVNLLGPTRLLNELRKEDIRLILNGEGESVDARLELPSAFSGKVVLLSTKPAKFSQSK